MAGPSGQTAVLHLPYPLPDDTVDVPRDVQALASTIDGISGIKPPIVTSLPVSPVDGQEVLFRAGTDPQRVLWHLRYDASQTDSHKWIYLGGGEMYSSVGLGGGGDVSTPDTATYTVWTLGPALTVPVTGVFTLEMDPVYVEARTGGATTVAVLLGLFADASNLQLPPAAMTTNVNGAAMTLRLHGPISVTAGQVLHLAYSTNNTPVRIGAFGARFDITPSRLG